MYKKCSEQFNSLVVKPGRNFRARILLGDQELNGFSSLKIKNGSNTGEALTLGSTVSQNVSVVMENPNVSLAGCEFELQIGLKLADGQMEYIPIGLFTPGTISVTGNKIRFSAYDRMMKLSPEYISELSEQTDTLSVLKEISDKTGVPICVDFLQAISLKKPVGYTYREVLMYVAQLYGCFANVNREGTIELHFWEDSGYEINDDMGLKEFTYGESYVVEQLSVTGIDDAGQTSNLFSGEGTMGVSFANPFMTQSIVDDVFHKISGFAYTPVTSSIVIGDPRIDPWDILTIVDLIGNSYKVPMMNLEFSYDGGIGAKIQSTVQSEVDKNFDYKGPLERLRETFTSTVEALGTKLRSEIAQSAEEIIASVEGGSDEDEDEVEKLKTQLTQTKNYFEFEFQKLVKDLGGLQEGVDKEFQELRSFIRLEKGAIILGVVGNELMLKQEHDQIVFLSDQVPVAYWKNKKFYASDGEFTKSFRVDNFLQKLESNGSLSLY